VGSEREAERYTADYGNLHLEVSLRTMEQEYVFEFIVTDKADGFIFGSGTALDLDTAQSSAISEAQLFLDPYITSPSSPQWRRDAELGAPI
jgi:2-keto-3-deoxy-6-phosphogluconate aldolase